MPGVREARASARRDGTPACWSVELFGGVHRTTNGHGFRQLMAPGQPGGRRSEDASRDGIGCRGTAGMRKARQRGSFGSEGVEWGTSGSAGTPKRGQSSCTRNAFGCSWNRLTVFWLSAVETLWVARVVGCDDAS
jgi:hypothetical protein